MYTCYIHSLRILTSFCSCAGSFESSLVRNPRRHVFACCSPYNLPFYRSANLWKYRSELWEIFFLPSTVQKMLFISSWALFVSKSLLCPQLRRSWRGILVSGCASICSSRTVHTRVLKFHIWIPHGKIADARFFLVWVISLSGVMPLWKNQNEIWCMPGAWNLVSW